ncbi:HDOD domain-containing protein [Desulfopila inferna]|uniref:HDOD domain-containing protein n=1 Tax=Desulfopila inferna TaxID=468528 RepID=UPI001965A7B3|nr:HDOD domain-containing protein [Desulfopila inferna]MBM9605065.1 HDOD domain-containing protein [Desulfopila inferna]
MSQAHLDAIYSRINSFPSLPATVSNVLKVTGDPESSANDLMIAILPDQSMCAALLKIANSAFFGLPRQVSTVEKAVMVLGFDEIKNIVLGKAVFNSFKELQSSNKQSIEQFWSHSFTCGLAAKIIAERVGLSPSEMFIAGLIHDIGKLAMLITFPNIYSHLLRNSEENWLQSCDNERELFFISHDEVAHRILKRWLFPPRLLNSVGFHHRPGETGKMQLFSSAIQIADVIAHIFHAPWGSSSTAHRTLILNMQADIFDIWHELELPCSSEEIQIWFDLLRISRERDTAILSIFTS